jgi:hypothetical protein
MGDFFIYLGTIMIQVPDAAFADGKRREFSAYA